MNCGAKQKKRYVTLTRHMIYECCRVWSRKKRIIQRNKVDICIKENNHQNLTNDENKNLYR